jgi:hypothetical protein
VLEQAVFDAHYKAAVRVTHNAAQSATTAVDLVLAFNTEIVDTESNAASTIHDTVTNNSRLTCRTAGVYQISGNVEFASNATGLRHLKIRLNGTTLIAFDLIGAVNGAVTIMTTTALYSLAVNDYVELLATQTSGGALNVNSTGNYSPIFSMVRVA